MKDKAGEGRDAAAAGPAPAGEAERKRGSAGDRAVEETRLPLSEHLDELRRRLIRSLLALGAGAAICYPRAEAIYKALLRPLLVRLPPDSHLVFTELTEAFLTYFKVALLGGLVLASPVISYQIWRFVSPGLYRRERKVAIVFSGWSAAAFVAGMSFAYFAAIPAVFSFLMGFGRAVIVPMPSMKQSLSLVLRLLLIFGVLFEIPLVLYLGGRSGILSPATLSSGRKVAVVAALLLGALLTPPDAVSQVLVAVPLYLLYEAGLILCAFGARRHARGARRP